MQVANLELSKELWNLSKWTSTDYRWYEDKGVDYVDVKGTNGLSLPAYNLGFLLRKLPQEIDNYYFDLSTTKDSSLWIAEYFTNDYTPERPMSKYKIEDENPEDCLCRLAIELFRQGILIKVGGENE